MVRAAETLTRTSRDGAVAPPPPTKRQKQNNDDDDPQLPDLTGLYQTLAVLAADAAFCALGLPTAATATVAAAGAAGVIAVAGAVYLGDLRELFLTRAEAEQRKAASVVAAAVAAAVSFLALCVVQAMKTSKAHTAAVLAGAALVATGSYFAKELKNGLEISVTRAPAGEKGGVGLYTRTPEALMMGEPSEKALKRLQSIRNILLEEFMEEETRLFDAEKAKTDEVARLQSIYDTRVRTLQREITILKNKNVELSVFAGKAASYDALKLRAETEIASLKKMHDAEITALKAQISGLEKTIEKVEREMAEERAVMAGKLAASRFERDAAKQLHDSEMRKYRAALSLSNEHVEWWKAESRRIDQKESEKRGSLEKKYAASMVSAVDFERTSAASILEKALRDLKHSSQSELTLAMAQALSERTALKTLMRNELNKTTARADDDLKSAVRAAVASAEFRVAAEWRAKVEKIETVNKTIAKTFTKEFERQRAGMDAANVQGLSALRESHIASVAAADAAHEKALTLAKLGAQNALAAAKRDALHTLEKASKANSKELAVATKALEEEQNAMKAQLLAERDEAVDALKGELRDARSERGALFAHFASEATKTETIVRARLANELLDAEARFEEFWREKTERLRLAHDAKYAQLWSDRTKEVTNLKHDLLASRESALRDERAQWAEDTKASNSKHESELGALKQGAMNERKSTQGLMLSEAAKAHARAAATRAELDAALEAQRRVFCGERAALNALLSSEASKARSRLLFATEDAIARGAAELALAEAAHGAEKDALMASFEAKMEDLKREFSGALEKEIETNVSAVEALWRGTCANAEKESALRIANASGNATAEIDQLKQALVSSRQAADAALAKSASAANETLLAASKHSERVLARLAATHENAIAEKDSKFAQALQAARAAAVGELKRVNAEVVELEEQLRAASGEYATAYDAVLAEVVSAKAAADLEMAVARDTHAKALQRLKDENDGALAAAVTGAATSTAARVDELSAELAGIKNAHALETERLTEKHKDTLSRSLRAAAEEMRSATGLVSEIEASRATDVAAVEGKFAKSIATLTRELSQTKADATNAAAAAAQTADATVARSIASWEKRFATREAELLLEIGALRESRASDVKARDAQAASALGAAQKASAEEVRIARASAEETRAAFASAARAAETLLLETTGALESRVAELERDASATVDALKAEAVALVSEAMAAGARSLQLKEDELNARVEVLKTQAEVALAAARADRETALAAVSAKAVAEVDAAVVLGGETAAALKALRGEYAVLQAARVTDASEADARLAEGRRAANEATQKTRAETETALQTARDAAEARVLAETSALTARLEAMEKESAESQADAVAEIVATLETTRADAAAALEGALLAADAERAELESAFSNEARRAREAFEAEIKAYDVRLSESTGDLSARHGLEIETLVATHAVALKQAVAAKNGAESSVHELRAEYAKNLEATIETHRHEVEKASRRAAAALELAAKTAKSDSEALDALKATEKTRAGLLSSLEQQRLTLEGEKNALSVELDLTNAELNSFLKLRRREETVQEQVNGLAATYARALRIQQNGLDPNSETQREALTKVGEEIAAAQQASIPTWAYYAIGVATALLPRLFGGVL